MFDLNKKEKPFTSFGGFGGGGLGLAGGGISEKTYVDDVFSTYVYSGTSGSNPINNGIDLAGEGGMVWFRSRDYDSGVSPIHDTERSAGGQRISTTSTDDQYAYNPFASINNNGFTLTGSGTAYNNSSYNYVSWTFRKAPGFFDVVTYPGDSDASRTISHNLGSTPGMIIVKCTSGDNRDWVVHHRSVGFTEYLRLNKDGDALSISGRISAADASTFTPGSDSDTNETGKTYVAYIFAHDNAQFGTLDNESIIKCGTYIGGGSTSVEVNLGFEPQWVLIKSADSGYNWQIVDNMRGISSGDDAGISANSNAQESQMDLLDLTATGFKTGINANANREDDNFIYMAIRRPNKPPEAAINVFAIDTYTGSIPNYISGFPVDFVINRDGINSGNDVTVFSRLLGTKRLKTNSTEEQGNAFVAAEMDHSTGYAAGTGTSPDSEKYSWMFKRAPGFMDVVAYSGDGTYDGSYTTNHNLGVAPEMIIAKNRGSTNFWNVYHSGLTSDTYQINLHRDAAQLNTGQSWGPTAASFKPQYAGNSDYSSNHDEEDYIAYLFATLAGISKVGSYSGNSNSAIEVNCGFPAGARFVLIKRIDSSGDWYLWDSTRGINPPGTNSGLDPYLLLNRDNNGTDAQVTNTNYIDPLTGGFKVNSGTSGVPAALNVTDGTYLFLAIA